MAEALAAVALFCLLFAGLGALSDYLESQESTLRRRYE